MNINFGEINRQNLPDLKSINNVSKNISKEIEIGTTMFMEVNSVKSEAEYKNKLSKQEIIMKHTHLSWDNLDKMRDNLKSLYNELDKNGRKLDRFGVSLDISMGVPEDKRNIFKDKEKTGLILKSDDEWKEIGQIVPIQPHFGDHIIGSLNSLENTKKALNAGVTTLGNISQYFTYEYEGLDMEEKRVIDMLYAISLMGQFKDYGTIIHSNVDDGFGSRFKDLSNLVGWCLLERYIVEDLLGANLSHCFGDLFSNSIERIIFSLAMDDINKNNTPGSMVYGSIIDYGDDLYENYAILSSYSLADTIAQKYCPTGHAITVIPATKSNNNTSVDEIVSATRAVDKTVEKAEPYMNYLDWNKIESDKKLLVSCGRIFFERTLNGLNDHGVDIQNPGELLVSLKHIGPELLETMYGSGKQLDEINREPIWRRN